METVIFALAGLLFGVVLSFIIIRKVTPEPLDLGPELAGVKIELVNSSAELNVLKGKYESLTAEKATVDGKLEASEDELSKSEKEVSILTEQLRTEKANNLDSTQIRESFINEFKNIANEVVINNTSKFNQSSSEKLSEVLKPFDTKIKDFEKAIKSIRDDEIRESTELKTQITSIRDLNLLLSSEAKRLTEALKGDNKLQGNWGELVLENLLSASGLRKGHDYIVQATGMDLKNNEGGAQRPDVLVKLPDEKHLVLDSKVSLRSYERYCSAENDTEKSAALKDFHVSVKTHIKGLGDKSYHMNEKINSPEFVFLFIPIEGAFSLYLATCDEAFDYAQDRNIYIVSPTTIMPTLKTAALIWRQQKQSKHTSDIMKLAGEIYDKFATMSTYLNKVEDGIDKSKEAFLDYKSRLTTGRKPIVALLEDMKDLGAKTSKEIAMTYEHPSAAIVVESLITEELRTTKFEA